MTLREPDSPWWSRGMLLVVGVIFAFLIGTVMVFTNTVKTYESTNRNNSIAGCERNNKKVASDIRDLRSDIAGLEAQVREADADIAGLRENLPHAVSWIESKKETRATTLVRIEVKNRTIAEKIAANAEFAVSPGSPVVDCDLAYPK